MRHQKKGRSLGRKMDQRTALKRSLVRSLLIHERIGTTEAKAKEIRPIVEKLVTIAKKDTVANRRLVASRLNNDAAVVKKLFTTIGPRYAERNGGYVRIVKRAIKAGTGRANAYIAFV